MYAAFYASFYYKIDLIFALLDLKLLQMHQEVFHATFFNEKKNRKDFQLDEVLN